MIKFNIVVDSTVVETPGGPEPVEFSATKAQPVEPQPVSSQPAEVTPTPVIAAAVAAGAAVAVIAGVASSSSSSSSTNAESKENTDTAAPSASSTTPSPAPSPTAAAAALVAAPVLAISTSNGSNTNSPLMTPAAATPVTANRSVIVPPKDEGRLRAEYVAQMAKLLESLEKGVELWKLPRSSFAKPKLVYVYLCPLGQVETTHDKVKRGKERGVQTASNSPYADYVLRWDSRKKSRAEAAVLLDGTCELFTGWDRGQHPKRRNYLLKNLQLDPEIEQTSFSLDTATRSLDFVAPSLEVYNAMVKVLSFVLEENRVETGAIGVQEFEKASPK